GPARHRRAGQAGAPLGLGPGRAARLATPPPRRWGGYRGRTPAPPGAAGRPRPAPQNAGPPPAPRLGRLPPPPVRLQPPPRPAPAPPASSSGCKRAPCPATAPGQPRRSKSSSVGPTPGCSHEPRVRLIGDAGFEPMDLGGASGHRGLDAVQICRASLTSSALPSTVEPSGPTVVSSRPIRV